MCPQDHHLCQPYSKKNVTLVVDKWQRYNTMRERYMQGITKFAMLATPEEDESYRCGHSTQPVISCNPPPASS